MGDKRIALAKILITALMLAVAGCATSYQNRTPWRSGFGYADEKIAEDTYKVTFLANSMTDRDTVLKLWHRRATELCEGSGYEHDAIYSERERRGSGNVYASFSVYRDPYVEGTVKCTRDNPRVIDINRP